MTAAATKTKRRTNVPGTVYLLCFAEDGGLHITGNKYAQHYIGWTEGEVADRVTAHVEGRGARLVRAVVRAGMQVELALTWENVDRNDERWLKNQHAAARYCQRCYDAGRTTELRKLPRRPAKRRGGRKKGNR